MTWIVIFIIEGFFHYIFMRPHCFKDPCSIKSVPWHTHGVNYCWGEHLNMRGAQKYWKFKVRIIASFLLLTYLYIGGREKNVWDAIRESCVKFLELIRSVVIDDERTVRALGGMVRWASWTCWVIWRYNHQAPKLPHAATGGPLEYALLLLYKGYVSREEYHSARSEHREKRDHSNNYRATGDDSMPIVPCCPIIMRVTTFFTRIFRL